MLGDADPVTASGKPEAPETPHIDMLFVEKYGDSPELQQQAIAQVKQAAVMFWRHMNGIYWHTLHGRFDDTPLKQPL